ncbi:MAG: hypothetical protein EA401_01110 [Planctomycetota bacterium]|nr:MAG: hypothetical protein EA401_01110 [Planctomycetota bacterium]
MFRCLLTAFVMFAAVIGPFAHTAMAESAPLAQRIAAQALRDQAQDHPQSQHVHALAQGVADGSVSLLEAEQVMRLLAFAQGGVTAENPALTTAPAPPSPSSQPRPSPSQDPREVLSLLDEAPAQAESATSEDPTAVAGPGQLPAAEEASIADLEAWAGTRSPSIPDADDPGPASPQEDRLDMPETDADGRLTTEDLPPPAADAEEDIHVAEAEDGPAPAQPSLAQASPTLRSDQAADLPAIDGRVRMVEQRDSGDRTMTMVILDQGERHGLENGHRLRVEREGEAVVLLTVFDVRDQISVAVVLDGSWKVEGDHRQVRIGDHIVRDR